MSRKNTKKSLKQIIVGILLAILILVAREIEPYIQETMNSIIEEKNEIALSYDLGSIPEYEGEPYVIINNNIPFFNEDDYTTENFEQYSELDLKWGRCGVAYANVCKKTMPVDNEDREDISSVEPTGWKQKQYKNLVDGDYLYNRCHLIGWQLTGENDNELNLITGTRYMNVEGMLPFENKVADYLKQKNNKENHVLYRVTPIFEGDNLVASGVQMEAYSVEDNGKGICFNVYVYNVQPGITIDYKTGKSWLEE